MRRKYSEELIEKTTPLIQERVKKLSDYLPLCEFFFNRPVSYEIDLSDKRELLRKMADRLRRLTDWKSDLIGTEMQELCQELGMKTGDFFMILRIAITGKKISPPLNESMEILGKEEVMSRLNNLNGN